MTKQERFDELVRALRAKGYEVEVTEENGVRRAVIRSGVWENYEAVSLFYGETLKVNHKVFK